MDVHRVVRKGRNPENILEKVESILHDNIKQQYYKCTNSWSGGRSLENFIRLVNRVIECWIFYTKTEIRLFVINQTSTSIIFDYLFPWIFCTIIMSNEFKVHFFYAFCFLCIWKCTNIDIINIIYTKTSW